METSSIINRFLGVKEVYAHCDIPCGIYTAEPAKTAAETVVKMVEKIQELAPPTPADFGGGEHAALKNKASSFMRYVMVKEQHAELCKRELLILWTDYFKPEHLAMFPDLHDKFWKATKLCSINKREVNMAKAQELKKAVEEIAEMFRKAEANK